MLSKETLTKITEGMKVYDQEDQEIGTIGYIQFGDEDPDQPGPETRTAQDPKIRDKGLMAEVADALSIDRIPDELKERLLRYGYIKVERALAADEYVPMNQLAEVREDSVKLTTTESELIKD